jgi:hypothetical protein
MQNVLPPAPVVLIHMNCGAAKGKWKGSCLPLKHPIAIWSGGNYLLCNYCHIGLVAAPKSFLFCLEELDSFRNKLHHVFVSWLTDKRRLLEIKTWIDVLCEQRRQQRVSWNLKKEEKENQMVMDEVSISRSDPTEFCKWTAEETWEESSLIIEYWRQSPGQQWNTLYLRCCSLLVTDCQGCHNQPS